MKFELFDRKQKTSPVVFIIRMNRRGHRIFLKYFPGFTIKNEHWNLNNQRVREISGIPWKDYNETLDIIDRTVTLLFKNRDYFSLNNDKIRLEIDVALKRKISTGEDFSGYLDKFIDNWTESKGYNTVKSFRTLRNKLPGNLNWHDIDYSFYLKFVKKLEKKEYSANYIGKMVNNLKIVMNHAHKEGKHDNLEFKKFEVFKEDVYNIYLSEEELIEMYGLKLEGHLEKARDLFMIGAWTGMRVENYLNIDPDVNIDLNKGRITAIINKNGPRVVIPIHWIIREIIEKYNGLPKSISSQKLNEYLKEIGKEAKLFEKIITVRTEGGKRIETIRRKWEMLTSHTARRSLATNLYLRGVKGEKTIPISYIMSITGHKTESMCLKYIKSGLDEMIDKVEQLDFWSKPSEYN